MSTREERAGWLVRKLRLGAETQEEPSIAALTPSERVQLVWPLTLNAWAFKEGRLDEPRLRRDVVRTLRGTPPFDELMKPKG